MTTSQPGQKLDAVSSSEPNLDEEEGPKLVGTRVGKYRVQSKLGAGGMGAVFVAVHEEIGQRAAIKALHPHLSKDGKLVSRFIAEARLIGMVGHPGLVKVYDFIKTEEGTQCIVMEFLEGVSLRARIIDKKGRSGVPGLPLEEALPIARQMASAIAAVHQRGIIHRDLKPENVMLVPDPDTASGERAKILDFGIAKLEGDDGPRQTTNGVALGTPTYMAPEQIESTQPPTDRIDVYAVGIILFELLSGEPPFQSDTTSGVLRQHLVRDPPPLPASVPADLQSLVMKALAKEPSGRPSMQQVVEEIDQLWDPRQPPSLRSSRLPVKDEKKFQRRLLFGASATLVSALIGTAYFVLLSPHDRKSTPMNPPSAVALPTPPSAPMMGTILPPIPEKNPPPAAVQPSTPASSSQPPAKEPGHSRTPSRSSGSGNKKKAARPEREHQEEAIVPLHFGDLPKRRAP